MLTEVHRQAEHSGILRLATQIRLDCPIPHGVWGDDAIVYPKGTKLDQEQMLAFDQVLVGRNKTRHATNRKLRKLHGYHDKYPEVGDRLVCLRNNHDIGLLNGAIFYTTDVEGVMDEKIHMSIRPEEEQSSIETVAHTQPFFGEEIPFYERSDAQEFDFGYALTCHKAQGSQWKSVCIFDESWCFKKDKNRWLYTAVTRASDSVTLIRM
jgi:exodeoxyribonuclease-5